MDARRIRETFAIDESVESALPEGNGDRNSQARYRAWQQTLDPERHLAVERLLPRVLQPVREEWPPYMGARRGHLDLSTPELRRAVDALRPWTIPFDFGDGVNGMHGGAFAAVATRRYQYRRDLIGGTVAALLGDEIRHATVLDIGCGFGFFSMDLADRGVGQVRGIDLRPENIARAEFLAEHYGVENVDFRVVDADAVDATEQYDVVVNLGVLYHVVNPLQFVRQTYDLCRQFAIIDTVCHLEPVSAYFVLGDKDTTRAGEGRETYEMHPTYRAVIDTIRYAGFRDVFEVVGDTDRPPDLYAAGTRRCFLAGK